MSAQVGGRAVLMVPHREPGAEETALPPEYQRILTVVRQAGGPVTSGRSARNWGWRSGQWGMLEPLRGRLSRLAGRGRLHKRPDGKFTVRP
ncbi:hypothetical protein ACIOGX_12105 [Streptomyces sp. NPDC088147]|uniref:hypothetical protein n=1 Tax=Streptomyces sp. NPDC088147 TaxID=3365830 RepID=UPI00381CCBCC